MMNNEEETQPYDCNSETCGPQQKLSLPSRDKYYSTISETKGSMTQQMTDHHHTDEWKFPCLRLRSDDPKKKVQHHNFEHKDEAEAHALKQMSRPIMTATTTTLRECREMTTRDSSYIIAVPSEVQEQWNEHVADTFILLLDARLRCFVTILARHGLSLAEASSETAGATKNTIPGVAPTDHESETETINRILMIERKLALLMSLGSAVQVENVSTHLVVAKKKTKKEDEADEKTGDGHGERPLNFTVRIQVSVPQLVPYDEQDDDTSSSSKLGVNSPQDDDRDVKALELTAMTSGSIHSTKVGSKEQQQGNCVTLQLDTQSLLRELVAHASDVMSFCLSQVKSFMETDAASSPSFSLLHEHHQLRLLQEHQAIMIAASGPLVLDERRLGTKYLIELQEEEQQKAHQDEPDVNNDSNDCDTDDDGIPMSPRPPPVRVVSPDLRPRYARMKSCSSVSSPLMVPPLLCLNHHANSSSSTITCLEENTDDKKPPSVEDLDVDDEEEVEEEGDYCLSEDLDAEKCASIVDNVLFGGPILMMGTTTSSQDNDESCDCNSNSSLRCRPRKEGDEEHHNTSNNNNKKRKVCWG